MTRAPGKVAEAIATTLAPATAALLACGYLVPPIGSGFAGLVAALGHRFALPFGVGLFLLFSGIGRYWGDRFAGARASTATTPPRGGLRGRDLLGLALAVVAAGGAALLLRAYAARPYRVVGESMLPTFEPDDIVAGSARGASSRFPPRRGAVVVFSAAALHGPPPGSAAIVKRVIGLPGDRIAMRGGTILINDWPVPSCDAGDYLHVQTDGSGRALHGRLRLEFLNDRAYLIVQAQSPPFPGVYQVKPGEAFVLGDDRSNSLDSRAYGGIPLSAIEAQVDRFLVGTHRSGGADFGRFLRPVDALQARVRLEGIETQPLDDGIARCLANRPTETRPPLPAPL